jgi:hydrogenase expression/formation protein HypE
MQALLNELVRPQLDNAVLAQNHDAALLEVGQNRLAFTTDSFVVRPLFFAGGDIGSLAVHGTVNDLASLAARPLYLSCSLILEEGFSLAALQSVMQSMRQAAEAAGVQIATGDTKVVEKGKGDGIYINTTGIGLVDHSRTIHPSEIAAGDAILINGDIGRHGIAILAQREGLEFETQLKSDSAPLADMVLSLIDEGIELRCVRDCTRGGLSSALNEIAQSAHLEFHLVEDQIPVHDAVRGACELLGFDPFAIANEGRMVFFVPQDQAEAALAVMRRHAHGEGSACIGRVTANPTPRVVAEGALGTVRIVDVLSGEPLPRIC